MSNLTTAEAAAREAMIFACEAIRDNLGMYQYKNEPLLLDAFKGLKTAIARQLADDTPKPQLSDDWHLDEPLAYLVKNYDTTMAEYRIFLDEREAESYAESQEELASEEGEPDDWQVYPLYAGHPLEH